MCLSILIWQTQGGIIMKILNKSLCLLLVFAILVSFNGCLLYSNETKAEIRKAQNFTEKFFSYISKGNIEEAEKYMHPQFSKDHGSLSDYLEMWEQEQRMDLSQGIYIVRVYNQCTSSTHPVFDGYVYHGYSISYCIMIGNILKECEVRICDDDNGYGIYDITFKIYEGFL